jgi:Kef-type K+ transport system membrane component KefB
MTDISPHYGILMLLLGLLTVLSVPTRAFMRRFRLPASVAFIGFGVLLSAIDQNQSFLTPGLSNQIALFAQIGIVALLFRVGMESDLSALAGQLRRAMMIWVPDITVAATVVFALIWFWPGFGLVPALLTGVAASATSVGVSISVWEDAGRIDTPEGALLLDVAELDDLSAVLLLSMIFVIVPQFQGDLGMTDWSAAAFAGLQQLVGVLIFSAVCFAFSRLLESRLSHLFARLDKSLGPFVFAAGAVFLIAALAEFLGFSMAIGALFAGLAFSRDPDERRIDDAFGYILAIFGPFFFMSIGLSVTISGLIVALPLAGALLAALIIGKLLGAGLSAAFVAGPKTGILLGASMIPRAEIYMIVMLGGLSLGDWAVPSMLYNAAVLAGIGTCLLGPIMVNTLLAPHKMKEQHG